MICNSGLTACGTSDSDDEPTSREDRTMIPDGAVIQKVEAETAWYATQEGRAVVIKAQDDDRPIARFEPPAPWGSGWSWNLCEGGIYFARKPRVS